MIIHFGVGAGRQSAIAQPFVDFGFPTLGEGGAPPEPEPEVATTGGHYAKGERRRRGLEWDRAESIEDRLQRVYDRLHGDLAEVAEPADVREAVAEHATASDAAMPPPAAIDFAGLAQDLAATNALLAAYEAALRAKAEVDDEEDAIVALLLA